jgi:SAM-dependent methyltransferase
VSDATARGEASRGRWEAPSAPRAPRTLAARYTPDDLTCFDAAERARFLAPLGPDADAALAGDEDAFERIAPFLAWELLYRKEPELWERLVAGEHIHPDVLARLPSADVAAEIAAGGGRLTVDVAPRCGRIVAVEPVSALREVLARKLTGAGIDNVEIVRGFFDEIPMPDASCGLVVSCSSFTPDESHGGESGLQEMDRVLVPGGMLAVVWPPDVDWLRSRGFTYESFDGEMCIDFGSPGDAVELARITYPWAADAIAERGSALVPYELIGMNPPRDIAWRRKT